MVIKNGTFLEATIVAFEKESQQGEKKAELATIRDEALQAQLKDAEAKAKARLRKAEESAQLAQQRADLAACQRSAIETQLKDAEEKAHLAQKITDLVAAQDGPTKREALKEGTDSVKRTSIRTSTTIRLGPERRTRDFNSRVHPQRSSPLTTEPNYGPSAARGAAP